jgi:hypothetical protein
MAEIYRLQWDGNAIYAPMWSDGAPSVGVAIETDTAFALGAIQIRAVGMATETSTALALALAGTQVLPVGMATESDTALALPLYGAVLSTHWRYDIPSLSMRYDI